MIYVRTPEGKEMKAGSTESGGIVLMDIDNKRNVITLTVLKENRVFITSEYPGVWFECPPSQ